VTLTVLLFILGSSRKGRNRKRQKELLVYHSPIKGKKTERGKGGGKREKTGKKGRDRGKCKVT